MNNDIYTAIKYKKCNLQYTLYSIFKNADRTKKQFSFIKKTARKKYFKHWSKNSVLFCIVLYTVQTFAVYKYCRCTVAVNLYSLPF